MNVVAVDIGGTKLRAAVYSLHQTTPLQVRKVDTHGKEAGVLERLYALVDSVWSVGNIEAISVASPGPQDPARGILFSTPNIPSWVNFPLGKLLEEKYRVPVYLENDANLAALGEWEFGAGRGFHDILYLTISTGIGGGVISNDRLISGHRGLATELGHITVLPDGPICSCGRRGHLEAIASGTAIARRVSEMIAAGQASTLAGQSDTLTARRVAEAALQGDQLSREAFSYAGRFLGQAVSDFLHMFNPAIVIFGGGVSQAGPLLFDPMKQSLSEHIMNASYLEDLKIAAAELGDDAGLLGALARAQWQLSQV